MIAGAILVVAILIIAAAALLPEDRSNPDRFFGLRLRGKREKPVQSANANVARMLAAARALRRAEYTAEPVAREDRELVAGHLAGTTQDTLALPVAIVADEPAVSHPGTGSANEAIAVDSEAIEAIANASRVNDPLPALDALVEAENAAEEPIPPLPEEPARVSGPIWPRLLNLDPSTLSDDERFGIVATLGAIGEDYVSPILCEVLSQERNPRIRDAALEAIRDARLGDAVFAVEECLNSERDRERVLAVEALSALDATEALQTALGDVCVAVVTAAARALRAAEAMTDDALHDAIVRQADENKAQQVAGILELVS